MCHRYKLASRNWCCQLLPCCDGEKSGSLMTNFWSFTVAATKHVQSDCIYVAVGIDGLLHVRARQCCSTPHLQNGCLISCSHVAQCWHDKHFFHYRTRLSSPSKQGSNWQHELRLASLYPWHIMTSALHHDYQRMFNQLPYFVERFWIRISSATTVKNFM